MLVLCSGAAVAPSYVSTTPGWEDWSRVTPEARKLEKGVRNCWFGAAPLGREQLHVGLLSPFAFSCIVNDDFLANLNNLKHQNLSGEENPTCRELRGFVWRGAKEIRDGIRNFPEDWEKLQSISVLWLSGCWAGGSSARFGGFGVGCGGLPAGTSPGAGFPCCAEKRDFSPGL